jgi:hypothetical protein
MKNKISKMSILFIIIISIFLVNCQSQTFIREKKEGARYTVLEILLYLQKNIPTLTYEIIPKWENNNRNVPFDAMFKLYENGRDLVIISRDSNAEAVEFANRETNNQTNMYKEYVYVWGRFIFIAIPDNIHDTNSKGSLELNIIDEQLNKEIYGIDRNPFIGEWKMRITYNVEIKFSFKEEIYSMQGFDDYRGNPSSYIEKPYWYTRNYIYMWFGTEGPYLMKYSLLDNSNLLILEIDRSEIRLDRLK